MVGPVAGRGCHDGRHGTEKLLYIERLDSRYRWSLVAKSSYPLLRITARFLKVDHHRIFVGFRTLEDEYRLLWDEKADATPPDAWTLVGFDRPTSADEITRRVWAILGTHG